MGHLINPIAFRLGHSRSWENIWYIKNIYYPEFLHNILNIRNFIYFFFRKKKLIKCGLFFSHFNILKYNKFYIVKLFIYHIDMEKISYELINNIYTAYYNGMKKRRRLLSKFFFFLHNSDLFLFLFIFNALFFKSYKDSYKKDQIKKYKFINNNFNNIKFSKKLLNKKNKIINNKFINNFNFNEKLDKSLFSFFKKNNGLDNNLIKNQIIYNKSEFDNNFFISQNIHWNYFQNLYLYICKKVNLKKYNNSWDFYNKWFSMLNFLKMFKYISSLDYKDKNYNYNNFYLYLASILYVSEILKRLNTQINLRDIIYYYIYMSLGKNYFFSFFEKLSKYWRLLFYYIGNFNNVSFYYYFLSNTDITACFLTRYIGLKLKKNYYLFHILNPIKKELWRISKLNRINKVKYFNLYKKYLYKLKFKFIDIVQKIINIYNSNIFLYYKNIFSFIFLNLFELKKYIKMDNEKYIKYYIINKLAFLNFLYYLLLNIFNNNIFNTFEDYKLKNIIASNLYKIFDTIIFFNLKQFKKVNINILLLSTNFIKLNIHYNYIKFLWSKFNNFNKQNIRNDIITIYKNSLVGYKMAFHGRFSRKQKSSSIWFSYGRVPLNKISINIDYSFFTIPLKNSAISIKIWLYKNPSYSSYKYILKT